MAYTTRIHKSILALSIAFVLSNVPVFAGDRGFVVITGHTATSLRIKPRYKGHYYQGLVTVDALDWLDYHAEPDYGGPLREKVVYSKQSSASKIIHVSEKMKQLGEARAARREAAMLENLDSIEFRFYRPNEAYDVRFPSIVYLDKLRR